MRHPLVISVGALATLAIAAPSRAQLVDPIPTKIPDSGLSVKLTPINTASGGGVTSPVYLTSAPDNSNRLFVVDQVGVVKVIQNGVTSSTPFLDVKNQI